MGCEHGMKKATALMSDCNYGLKHNISAKEIVLFEAAGTKISRGILFRGQVKKCGKKKMIRLNLWISRSRPAIVQGFARIGCMVQAMNLLKLGVSEMELPDAARKHDNTHTP